MRLKTRLFLEFCVAGVILSLCVGGGVYSCVIKEYTNGISLFISAPTIVMALWYLSRIARAMEAWVMRQAAPAPSARPEARPTTDEVHPRARTWAAARQPL